MDCLGEADEKINNTYGRLLVVVPVAASASGVV